MNNIVSQRIDKLVDLLTLKDEKYISKLINIPRDELKSNQALDLDLYFLYSNLLSKYQKIFGRKFSGQQLLLDILDFLIQKEYLVYQDSEILPKYQESKMKNIYDDFFVGENKEYLKFLDSLETYIMKKKYQTSGFFSEFLKQASKARDYVLGPVKFKSSKTAKLQTKQMASPDFKITPKILSSITLKFGPESSPEKYGLYQEIGEGKYGKTFIVLNLDKLPGEDKLYVAKILKPNADVSDWIQEIECLTDILDICEQVGILCYKDSFVIQSGKTPRYIIITPFLNGYYTLDNYLYDKTTQNRIRKISTDEALNIYKQVIDVKNKLTQLCINHSDLHPGNIMYNPKTKDVKIIDLGRCQTPQEEFNEWKGKISYFNNIPYEDMELYSDAARIKQLQTILYNSTIDENYTDKLLGGIPILREVHEYDLLKMFRLPKILANPGCVRKPRNRNLLPKEYKIMKQDLNL